jgi:cysteine desulfurase
VLYLDHNATTPLDPAVRAAMDACLDQALGNPSSLHAAGQAARRLIDRARAQVAKLIGARPDEIVLCTGGTEAANLAIFGAVGATDEASVLTSGIEHQAVLEPCRELARAGHAVRFIAPGPEGRLDVATVADALTDDTRLVSLMLANNEVGTLQPLAEIVAAVRERCPEALIHTDAVQAVGKIRVDVEALGVDLLSLSGHKLYGPQGVGALYVKSGTQLSPRSFGGNQERGLRPGTENVAAIVGLGEACELAGQRLEEQRTRIAALRDRFERELADRIGGVRVNGAGGERICNTSNLSFSAKAADEGAEGELLDGEMLAINLDLLDVAVSTGSACSTADRAPSHVLEAMGRSAEAARSVLRVSLGHPTRDEDIDQAIERIATAVDAMRSRTKRAKP